MKKLIAALVCAVSVTTYAADTTNSTPPSVLGTNTTSSIGLIGKGIIGLGLVVYDAMPTNIAFAPYATYALKPKQFGGGLAVCYNMSLGPVKGGPMVAFDYIGGHFLGFNGGLTFQTDIHPLGMWGITNFVFTPIAITGIGTPITGAGSDNMGLQTASSIGADIKFGHLWGGQFFVGGAYGTRTGAGSYDGGYLNVFGGWKKGSFKVLLQAN